MYPNPASSGFAVSGAKGTVVMTDMLGHIVREFFIDGTVECGRGTLTSGIYLLTVTTSTGTAVQKLCLR